ncbi:RNA dependent RNA polymerase-domain-containing protein [Phaeosphaeriaceae sp. PMI808]|nr:RNA dependent RNA polymerase-domain-containing protein [Phaeosphaeriaceae sp. PMI808]
MRQSPRLNQGNHDAGVGASLSVVPTDSVAPPRTPQHTRSRATLNKTLPKSGEDLNKRVQALEDEWRLGLRIRGNDWSPTTNKDTADRIYGNFKTLYYTRFWKLGPALDEFRSIARDCAPERRLNLLHDTLKSKIPPNTPSGPRIRNLQEFTPSHSSNQPTRSTSLFQDSGRGEDGIDSYHTTASADPGSPTDVDDDDYHTPPSPSKSAAQRRGELRQLKSSSESNAMKRLSEGSSTSENSPKNTRTSKGKQPVDNTTVPNQFKKPLLPMAHSFPRNEVASWTSSTNTSFEKTNSVFSSQQTQATSANTSFDTDGANEYAPYNGFTRRSSTSLESLLATEAGAALSEAEHEHARESGREHLFLRDTSANRLTRRSSTNLESISVAGAEAVMNRYEREHCLQVEREQNRIYSQEASRESNSTYGSVDDDMFYDATNTVEEAASSHLRSILSLGTLVQEPKEQNDDMRHIQNPPRAEAATRQSVPATGPKKWHIIRDIPTENLFVSIAPSNFRDIPYFIQFICQYLAVTFSIPLEDLFHAVNNAYVCANSESFWSAVEINSSTKTLSVRKIMGNHIWQAAKREFEGYTFKGKILFTSGNDRSKPVFCFQPLPIQADKSCRFQRKFGADRFLYVTAPTFESKSSPRFTYADMRDIRKKWDEWLSKEHTFLNRKWRVFHIEPMRNKKSRRGQGAAMHDKRIVLFATEGCGIEQPCSVGEMLNWFLPLAKNQDQPFCKAYARFDLGLSRTVPTVIFKPSQVSYVADSLSNGEEEATEFNDPRLRWMAIIRRPVMNDGCSLISVAAAIMIWKQYREVMGIRGPQPLPSAFQGRIGGAKGMWIVSGESFSKDPKDLELWIQINESQLKFKPHPEDLSDDTFDPLRLTFEVSNYSSAPSPSELHVSFIQILIDRGVPRNSIAALMENHLDADRADLLDALKDPTRMYEYMHRNGAKTYYASSADVPWQAAMPVRSEDKIRFLLESGFHPAKSTYLAATIERFIQDKQLLKETKLRTPLGKSTFLFGVADPLGVLPPGEVHVNFSKRFLDELTEESFLDLKNRNILVARQPACRRSDVQKVRAVVHPALSHLPDVVIFSSRGQFPLAGKLQGGDYDGDLFWLCWEDTLVDPFRNAPAPVESPDPTPYGIKVDKRELKDVMNPNDLNSIDSLLQEAFKFRSDPSLLGQVTVLLEKLAYRENRIFSAPLDKLCGLHDLLVDAAKQGYIYTDQDFMAYRTTLLGKQASLKQPAYKLAMEDCSSASKVDEVDKIRQRNYKHKPKQPVDWLYFDIFRRHNTETSRLVKQFFANVDSADCVLIYPYKNLADKKLTIVNGELGDLKKKFAKLYSRWSKFFCERTTSTTEEKNSHAEDCYRIYQAMQPSQLDVHDIKPWVEAYCNPDTSLWDSIKASTLYACYPSAKQANFVFKMAGLELARLKARSFPGSREMILSIYANMKPRRIKAPAELDEADDESEDEFQNAVEHIIS